MILKVSPNTPLDVRAVEYFRYPFKKRTSIASRMKNHNKRTKNRSINILLINKVFFTSQKNFIKITGISQLNTTTTKQEGGAKEKFKEKKHHKYTIIKIAIKTTLKNQVERYFYRFPNNT